MAGHRGAIFNAREQQPQQLQQHHTGLRCVCKELCVLGGVVFPLYLLLPPSSHPPQRILFLERDAVISAALSMLPFRSTCRTKLNPAVNTVGKENDFNLCKSVIKRWAGDFSCFQRNAGLIYDFIREPASQELPGSLTAPLKLFSCHRSHRHLCSMALCSPHTVDGTAGLERAC